MAKKPTKTNKVKLDNDMDLSEFGDLADLGEGIDFGDEMGADETNRKPSRAKVLTDLGRQAGSSALDEIIKNTAKKALPDEYSANYHEAMDLASFTAEVVDRNKQALNKSSYKLGKEVKKILPFKLGLLDKYLASQEANFESAKTQTEEEIRQAGISSDMASIFDKQLEVQKSLYARTEAQNQVDTNERLIQNKLSQDVLANMDGNIAHQTAFMTQISKEYYKRSLELQYKSFYVQADSLKTMREYYKAFTIQFTNIEKNTSLPDFVKLNNTEKLQDILREQAVQSVYSTVVGNNKYLQSMKKKMSGMVDNKVNEITTAMDGATSMLDMVNSTSDGSGGSSVGMLAGVGASMGGGVIGEKLAKMIPQKYLDRFKNNRRVQQGANYMGMLGASPSSLLEAGKEITAKKAEETQDQSTFGRKIYNKGFSALNTFLNLSTPDAENAEIKTQGYLTHNQPAIFDKNVHRSITEVIPMYLSKILQTNSNLTEMYGKKHKKQGSAQALVYDYEQRKLGSQEDLNRNVKTKLFTNTARAPKAKMVGTNFLSQTYLDASRKEGADKKELKKLKTTLDKSENSAALASYIEKAIEATGDKVDFNTLINNYESNQKLVALVEGDKAIKGLKELIEVLKTNQPTDVREIDSRLKDVTRDYPLGPVKTAFVKASELSGQPPHLISDKVAATLSRAFVTYIQTTNKDVTPQGIINTSVLKGRITVTDGTPELMDAIAIFTYNLKKIASLSQGNDITNADSAIRVTFAIMSSALRNGTDILPDVFKTLNELSASIIGPGKLTAMNIREGSLDIMRPGDYLSESTLTEAANRKPLEIQNTREETIQKNLIDRITSRGREISDGFRADIAANRSNPRALMDLMINRVKTTAREASTKLTNKGKELGKTLSDLTNNAVNIVAEGGVKALSEKYDTAIVQMDAYIVTLKEELAKVVADIELAESTLQDTMQEGDASARISNSTRAYKASVENSLKLLEATNVNMKAHKLKIDEIKDGMAEGKKIEVYESLKKVTSESLKKMTDALAVYESVGRTLRT